MTGCFVVYRVPDEDRSWSSWELTTPFILVWLYWKPIFVCGEFTYYILIYVKIILNMMSYHVYYSWIHLYRFLNSIIFKHFFIRSDFNWTFIQPYSGCSWNLLYNFMDHDSWHLHFKFNVFLWIIQIRWGYVYHLPLQFTAVDILITAFNKIVTVSYGRDIQVVGCSRPFFCPSVLWNKFGSDEKSRTFALPFEKRAAD